MPPRRDRFFKRKNKGAKFQNRGPPRKKEYRHQDQLTEVEVGITEFVGNLEGFSGIIKARFSDFQVNEISLDGTVAKLTDTGAPADFVPKSVKIDYNSVINTPMEKIPQEKWDALKSLVSGDNSETITIEADNLSKNVRTEIYKCIKNHFGQKLVASTVTVEDKKYMQFKKYDKEEKIDLRFEWPDDKGEYVHFLVYKEAMDTMEVCLKISTSLGMSPGKFTYAGVKDKRAKTTQWFCVHKVQPWKLMKKARSIRNLKIGNFTFKDEPLKLGQLQGNKFRIALRNVTGSDELINKSMEFIKENGFINFYGLQRFGNDKEVPTYEIGVKLLLGKWKEAVLLILKPKASDDPLDDVSKAKKVYFESGDANAAFAVFEGNNRSGIEVRLLQGLQRESRNDFVNALEKIPRNMRLLYIHSFQSLIWNKMVSKRLQLFGMEPVEGDLVLMDIKPDEIEKETPVDPKTVEDKDREEYFKCKLEVKSITADEISNYTIYDIVLPLPGYDILYPENLKQCYQEALEEFGLTLQMTRQRVKTYTLCGDYRKILENAKNVSWKITHYNDPTDNLIRSDFEELKGDPEPKGVKDGKYKGLVMEFDLPASSYATMVLREVLKQDTSSSAHARLNDYHESQSEKRIIIESTSKEPDSNKSEICEVMIDGGSLLSNAEKFEEFKNSIFECVEAPAEKRKNDDDSEEGSSKKQKTQDKEQTRIVMETPLL